MNYRFLFKIYLILCATSVLFMLFLHLAWEDTKYEDSNVRRRGQTNISKLMGIIEMRKRGNKPEIVDEHFYDFLYGDAFQRALDRANAAPKKKILYWHPPGDFAMTENVDLPFDCGGCEVRNDLSMIYDNNTEAVVIHYDSPLPKRNPKHYWIWRCAEAPPYISKGSWIADADKVGFNMTYTYRRDSDFRAHYGDSFMKTRTALKDPLKNKDKLALIAISNCDATFGAKVRLKYVNGLIRRGLRLTKIGSCFWFNSGRIPRKNHNELLEFTSKHKFYFAMENSFHCKDYITEKFFRALHAGAVPVVWGARREAYERHVPSSGFIFIDDFPSMESLIDYIEYLDKNDTAYLEFFKWRQEGRNHPEYRRKSGACQMCRFLHGINVDDAYKVSPSDLHKGMTFINNRPGKRVISSLKNWWNEAENRDCF